MIPNSAIMVPNAGMGGGGGGRTLLTANKDYYYATTGSDSNDGSIGSPWATPQHAANVIAQTLDIASFTVIVHGSPGTYQGIFMPSFIGGGIVYFRGAGSANETWINQPTGPVVDYGTGGSTTVVSLNRLKLFSNNRQPCLNNYATPTNFTTGDFRGIDITDMIYDTVGWVMTTGGSGGCLNGFGDTGALSGAHTFNPSSGHAFGWFFSEFDTPIILTGKFYSVGTPTWDNSATRQNTRATLINNAATFIGAAAVGSFRWDSNFTSAVCDNDAGVHWLPGTVDSVQDDTSTYGSFNQKSGTFEWVNTTGHLGASLTSLTLMNSSSPQNFVVTSAANMNTPFPTGQNLPFPLGIGAEVRVIQKGTGAVTFVPDTGVTLHNAGMLNAQWSGTRLVQLALDEWIMLTG